MLAFTYAFILLGMVQAALRAVIDASPKNALSARGQGTRLVNTAIGPDLDSITNEEPLRLKNGVGLKIAIGALISQKDSDWVKKHIKSDNNEDITDSATFTIYQDGIQDIQKKISLEDVRNTFTENESDRDDWWWMGCMTALVEGIGRGNDLTKKQADPQNILRWLTGQPAVSVDGLSDKEYFTNLRDKVVVLVNNKDNHEKVEKWSIVKGLAKAEDIDVDDEDEDLSKKFDKVETSTATFNTTSDDAQFWTSVGYTGLTELKTDYDTMIVLKK